MAAGTQTLHYFRIPSLYYWIMLHASMGLFTVVTFFPGILPYSYLGAVGSFLYYLGYNHHTSLVVGSVVASYPGPSHPERPFLLRWEGPGYRGSYIAAWGAHGTEALYVWSLCKKLNITEADTVKWVIQTFLIGFPSTLIIRAKFKAVQKKQ